MGIYADTSFLASYYLPDAHSARAQGEVQRLSSAILFTALHRLELRNALGLAQFRGQISSGQAGEVWKDVQADLGAGLFEVRSVKWFAAMRAASILSIMHTPATGTRTMDVLHVAIARKLEVAEFLSFDGRQRSLAALLGLTVRP